MSQTGFSSPKLGYWAKLSCSRCSTLTMFELSNVLQQQHWTVTGPLVRWQNLDSLSCNCAFTQHRQTKKMSHKISILVVLACSAVLVNAGTVLDGYFRREIVVTFVNLIKSGWGFLWLLWWKITHKFSGQFVASWVKLSHPFLVDIYWWFPVFVWILDPKKQKYSVTNS